METTTEEKVDWRASLPFLGIHLACVLAIWTGVSSVAAASVLLALDELLRTRIPGNGERVLLRAFGAGLTWCAAVFEWGASPTCV